MTGDAPPAPAGLAIRPRREHDDADVARVVSAAFGSADLVRLVHALRACDAHVADLDLVADVDGAVVGHVMATWAVLGADPVRPVLNLSPLSVHPSVQGRGIGSALVRAVSDGATRRDEPLVVLEGDPTFYRRLGYVSAAEVGIDLPLAPWAPPEAAQVTLLPAYDPRLRGPVTYPSPFDEVGEH